VWCSTSSDKNLYACVRVCGDRLISTDAMSRGIDVTDIDCVVSYDVPRVFTTYVHRVGRTARAGRPGTAFTLLEKREVTLLTFLVHVAAFAAVLLSVI